MKTSRNAHRNEYTDDDIYGPFDFDMDLNAGDYLYLAMYFAFIFPIILLSKAVMACLAWITGKTSQKKKNNSHGVMSHRIHALISKFF